jgi:hypothetical protein
MQSEWIPKTEQDKQAIREQLERLLANPHFHNSKRYPSFLKFVVTQSIEGQSGSLKERTVGIEVFGCNPDYDTTSNPIVRVTAAEVRKRIAQYYQDPGHEQELRLLLPSGGYAPRFYWPTTDLSHGAAEPVHEVHAETSPLPEVQASVGLPPAIVTPGQSLFSRRFVAIAVVATVLLGAFILWQMYHDPAIDQFWRPFVKSEEPILFCIADQRQFSTITLRDAADPLHESTLRDEMVTVIIDDISPLVNMAGMLQVRGKEYQVKGEAATTLTDLRRGPSVFIGAFDNNWTLRLTSPLRFHFANNADMSQLWIEDREKPADRTWLLDRGVQQKGTYKDYAIVARFIDPNTDRLALVVAGIARGGTVAAGEFLVDPRHMNDLLHQAPEGAFKKNIEIVLETQVIDNRSGPPRVAAVYVW